jgi:single-strand DNA-binding protein
MNLNKIFIIGNLTRDPELKTLPSGASVCSFGLATNRIWKDQNGQKQQDTQFHNIVVFGRQAEVASQYLTKGSLALIEGRIQNRTWDAADGTKKNRTEIVAERVQFGPRRTGGGREDTSEIFQPKEKEKEEQLETIEYPDEDIKPEEIPF